MLSNHCNYSYSRKHGLTVFLCQLPPEEEISDLTLIMYIRGQFIQLTELDLPRQKKTHVEYFFAWDLLFDITTSPYKPLFSLGSLHLGADYLRKLAVIFFFILSNKSSDILFIRLT